MEREKQLEYNRPWILQRADPYVYRHTDGWYYFTASVPAYDGICLRRAKTLAELPEAEEVELEIAPGDLQIDTYRSSGAGGQHVNKTESAIRITHLPTGTVVECQDERSQHKNKEKAMKILRSRLYERMLEEQNAKIASERKLQVGTGDRSERIRTYNYPQGRLTDHRIGLTLYRLEAILNGDLDEVVDALRAYDQAEKLKSQGEE